MKNEKEIRYIDLFGGVGGFRLGIEQATNIPTTKRNKPWGNEGASSRTKPVTMVAQQFTCVFYNDFDKYAVQTYNKNFKENWKATDIRTIKTDSIPDFDLLCAGFPCQAFSIAGKRKGFEDTRGTLFYEIARILKAKRPKYFLLENVKGLLSHDRGRTFAIILSTLAELGYDIQWMVLNSKFFGVPQNRERVFIVGSLRGTSRPEILPFGKVSSEDIELQRQQEYTNTLQEGTARDRQGSFVAESSKFTQIQRVRNAKGIPQSQIVKGTEGVSSTINALGGGQGAKTGLYIVRGRPKMPYESGKRKLNYVKYEDTCPTLSENCASGDQKNIVIKDMKIRRLTPIECERLQGFPDNWTKGVSDTQRYKQMGNAVTVNVVQAIIQRMFR